MSVRSWVLGGCAVVVLVMFGSCIADSTGNSGAGSGSTPSIVATTPIPIRDQDVWIGRVTSYPEVFNSPRLEIQLEDGTTQVVEAAHTRRLYCRGSGELEAISDRLRELAPTGSTVTFVRGASSGIFGPGKDAGFIHLPEEGRTATVDPYGISINETLLREGRVDITDPAVDLSVLTGQTVSEAASRRDAESPKESPNKEYWPVLLDAYTQAWNERINIQNDCRMADDSALVERDQRDELDRIRRGPDGRLGTDDDDKYFYEFDVDGNLRLIPNQSSSGDSSSSGGGWSSGGGGFCRSRWC